jgi:hypothetical protein
MQEVVCAFVYLLCAAPDLAPLGADALAALASSGDSMRAGAGPSARRSARFA